MRIHKSYEVPTPIEARYEHQGEFVCEEETAQDERHVIGFIEYFWRKAGNEDYVVGFDIGQSEVTFSVNGRSKDIVAEVIDEAVERISSQFPNVREVSDLAG